MKPQLLFALRDAGLGELYQRFFSERGYQVKVVSSGLECMDRLREGDFAALVLDWELLWGGSDGILEWLREEWAYQALPVVLLTTRLASSRLSEQFRPPVVHSCEKFGSLQMLLESVRLAVTPSLPAEESTNGLVTER